VPDYLAPGVYVEEILNGLHPIEGVSTSTAGFVGETGMGPSAPTLITSWAEFERVFGGFIDGPPLNHPHPHLPYAVRGFFDNGGKRAFVARVAGPGGGADPATLQDYVGDESLPADDRRGLAALATIGEIALLAAPDDVTVPGLRDAVIATCERMTDRFAVVSLDGGLSPAANPQRPRESGFGAAYYPWIRVAAPHRPGGSVLVPSTGHVLGIYARVDVERGVHKAPANEVVHGLTGEPPLEFSVTHLEQDALNQRGINVIRDFRSSGRGIRVWGARTLTADSDWKYVNVRRLLIFIETSIDGGTQWVVFEPNVERTWLALRAAIESFLVTVWRSGALAGARPDEAFFVKCDETTMTQDDIDNGRLVCLVGVAPVKPAEFVIVRIWKRMCSS
jgi:phage tail sheath protein FI